ncbi:MAG: hypothetical protein CBB81_03090 [Cellvibrionales bacterium TMED21]|nr:hypothetical protein [Halieaceae bacterium]OUT66786.1 MAG: hypothetical protein CBB81_03090 [Cellvibrionales bacterium TMED21]
MRFYRFFFLRTVVLFGALLSLSMDLLATNVTRDLDVGIVVKPMTLPSDATDIERSFRNSEAQLIAALLKESLEFSQQWGAVRVFEAASTLPHVLCLVSLEQSNGEQVYLRVRAKSVSGRSILDTVYRYETTAGDYVDVESDPYQAVFTQFAEALESEAHRASLNARRLQTISELRYALTLSDAFAGYLKQSEDLGEWGVVRIPAANDPMLARINRLRDYEILFVDAIDEQRVEQKNQLLDAYTLWRRSSREQLLWLRDRSQRLAQRQSDRGQSEFVRLNSAYATYRAYKLHQQELYELVVELESEGRATVVETDEAVYQLSGTLDAQSREWQRTLATIFALENPTQ